MDGVHDPGGRRRSGNPLDELVGVGVDRESRQLDHLGPNRYVLTEELEVACALQQQSAPCALGLEADEDDRVAWIGETNGEMVEHASTARHTCGRDHDRRIIHAVDRLRPVHVVDLLEGAGVEGVVLLEQLRSQLGPPFAHRLSVHGK